MGFLLVTAVLVVSLGRVGDIYGRVKMYNLGFAIFTIFSILLSVTWLTGVPGAFWIIIMRVFQGVGGVVPLTLGFLIVCPLAGVLSDRYGARLFATAGLIVSGVAFLLLELLPINFSYVWFGLLIFLFAAGMGLFFSPNQAAVMNSLPPDQRGAGAGMMNTFQNSATVLSMGLFFTIVTLGLADHLPAHLYKGLVNAGVSPAAAHVVANEPRSGACSPPSSATTRSRNCSARPGLCST
jgi:MFS family permease